MDPTWMIYPRDFRTDCWLRAIQWSVSRNVNENGLQSAPLVIRDRPMVAQARKATIKFDLNYFRR